MDLNLTLAVSDLAVTESFYRDILQLRLERLSLADFLIVDFDNIQVVFQPLEQLEQQHPSLLQHLGRSRLGCGLQLELGCPDLDTVERQLERWSWPIVYELDDREHQRRELWVEDPDGYLLVLNGEQQ